MRKRQTKKTDAEREEINEYSLIRYYASKTPLATEIELSVLAACMSNPFAAGEIVPLLKPQWFGIFHQDIFTAIRFLSRCNQPVTVETVAGELERRHVELPDGFLMQILSYAKPSDNYGYQARIIGQIAMVREIMQLCQQYAVIDPMRDCEEVYASFKQGCQELARSVAMKPKPDPSFHLITPIDKLAFGKYRGYTVAQVAIADGGIEYLEWVEDNVSGCYIDWPLVYDYITHRVPVSIGMLEGEP